MKTQSADLVLDVLFFCLFEMSFFSHSLLSYFLDVV